MQPQKTQDHSVKVKPSRNAKDVETIPTTLLKKLREFCTPMREPYCPHLMWQNSGFLLPRRKVSCHRAIDGVIVTFAGSAKDWQSLEALDVSSTSVESLSPALVFAHAVQPSTSLGATFCGTLCTVDRPAHEGTGTDPEEPANPAELAPSLKKGGDKKWFAHSTGRSSLHNGMV